jgi:hypothetical protein
MAAETSQNSTTKPLMPERIQMPEPSQAPPTDQPQIALKRKYRNKDTATKRITSAIL